MRVLKTPSFTEWARKEGLSDAALAAAVNEMEDGLLGNSMGSSLYKKRIRLRSKGKRGGARTIIAYRQGNVAIFLFGFSKGERANVSRKELEVLKRYSQLYLGYSGDGWNRALNEGAIFEVKYDG